MEVQKLWMPPHNNNKQQKREKKMLKDNLLISQNCIQLIFEIFKLLFHVSTDHV